MSSADPFQSERDMFSRAFGSGSSRKLGSIAKRHDRLPLRRARTRPGEQSPGPVGADRDQSKARPAPPAEPDVPQVPSSCSTADSRGEDLLTMMTARLRTLENSRRQLRDALVSKEKECIRLRARLDAAERAAASSGNYQLAEEMEAFRDENERLRAQVFDMETFLSDYGLVWVGDDDTSDSQAGALDEATDGTRYAGFQPARDALVLWQRVEALNRRAGEGSKRIVKDSAGAARLAEAPRVPFALFRDGFLLWRGPFRALWARGEGPEGAVAGGTASQSQSQQPTAAELRANQAFLADVLDGYFPAEFKQEHPGGVVLQMADHSDLRYDEWVRAGRPKGRTMEEAASAGAGAGAGAGKEQGGGGKDGKKKQTGAGGGRDPFAGPGARVGGAKSSSGGGIGAGAVHAGAIAASGEAGVASGAGGRPPPGPRLQKPSRSGPSDSRARAGAGLGGALGKLAGLGGSDEMPLPLPRDRLLGRLSERAVSGGRVVSIRDGVADAMARGGKSAIQGTSRAGDVASASQSGGGSWGRQDGGGVILADTRAMRSLRGNREGGRGSKGGASDGTRAASERGTADPLGMTFRPQSARGKEEVQVSGESSTARAMHMQSEGGYRRQGTGAEEESESGSGSSLCPPDVSTLQVKSDSGRQKILVKLFFTDTVGDLRRAIDQYRQKDEPYQIRTAYPNRAYQDDDETLEEAGLVPNAAVRLVRVKKGQ